MDSGVKLRIGNSECVINGLSDKQFKELRQRMSYKIDSQASYFSQDHRGGVRYLLAKRGQFPTGLLYIAEDYLKTKGLVASRNDNRTKPAPQAGFPEPRLPLPPYTWQKAAAEACRKAGRGIVTAPTGTGKSVAAALIIGELKVNTLVVVPSIELKKQLTASLAAYFPKTGMVGGLGHPIGVVNVDALDPELDINAAYGYHCVIIDEFHHSGAATYRLLNKKAWKGVYHKIGLTATPFRSNENERLLLESVLSKVIYRLRYDEAVRKKYIVPVEAYYYELPKRPVEGYTWAQVYKELVVDNEPRNALIVDLLHQLADVGAPTLCLVKEIKHGENLIGNTKVKFIKGENPDNREKILEFNLGQNILLVATTGVMGEGVDTKPCEYVIIAGLGKSKNQFMQQCGRGVRRHKDKESCKVILFLDRSHKWTAAHFKAQVKVLREEYGVVPVKLEA